jgi:hypothetical protein
MVYKSDLLVVVGAGDRLGLGLGLAQRRQEQARQDGNDGDNDQQLDQGKPARGRDLLGFHLGFSVSGPACPARTGPSLGGGADQ